MALEEHDNVFRPRSLVPNATASTPSNGISTNKDFKAKLAQLETSIAGLSTNNEGKSVSVFDYNFRNLQEFGAHPLAKNVNHFGGIVDGAYTFCQWIKADSSLDTTKLLWESLLKLSLPTPAEGCSMEAFQNYAPDLFHKGGPFSPIGKHESSLDQLPSFFSNWHNASGTGFGDTMKDMIPQVELAIQSYIDKHFAFGTDIHTLATHCLRNTTAWLLDSIKFIFDNQEAYTSSQFSVKTAWALNSKLIKRIFGDVAAVRLRIRHSF